MDRVKRLWYLLPIRAAKVQASLRIRAVSPEPSLLAHTSSESRGTFRQKARSLAPLNGWACAVKLCHDEMLEDTNSLDGAHIWYEVCVLWTRTTKVPSPIIAVWSGTAMTEARTSVSLSSQRWKNFSRETETSTAIARTLGLVHRTKATA